jgi:hypothetical protein
MLPAAVSEPLYDNLRGKNGWMKFFDKEFEGVDGQGGEAGARGGTQDQERGIPHQKMRRHVLNVFQGFCLYLTKKGAGTCLIYSRVSASPSQKSVQAGAKCLPGFLLLRHQKGCRHVLNLFQGFCFFIIKKGAGMC